MTVVEESLPEHPAQHAQLGGLVGEPLPRPLVKAHGQFRFQLTLRGLKPRALSRHVQKTLAGTTLPDEVTVVFDMDAYDFG